MNLIQLGANVGNDHVQKFIENHSSLDNIILVEPISKCHPVLEQNYIHIKNTHIEPSVIISDLNSPPGEVDFYMVDYPEYKPEGDNYEVSSLYEDITRSRANGWENLGKKIKLKSLNFESLVSKYNLQTVDFLFCDIEGEDEKVLNNLDLSKYDFKLVMWEENTDTDTLLLKNKFKALGFQIESIVNNKIAYKQEYENYIPNFRQWLQQNKA
jgi:FkbM family methyltransferase